MLEVGIAQLVAANAGVQALIGNPARLYPVVLPDNIGTPNGPAWPCATYQVISDVPEYVLPAGTAIEVKRIQVDTWSGGPDNASYAAAKAVQAAIRAVLDLYFGQLADGTRVAGIFVAHSMELFEQDARAYRTTTDYMVHFYPTA
jgi:hypothetical protein